MGYDEDFAGEGLFQIGDVAKCCGVNRQTILFYQRQGLLTPTWQSKSSGYRYYSTEAVTELMQILQLRDAGLSLREINDYVENGPSTMERVIASMEEKMEALQSGLEQARAVSIEKGDYSVTWTNLPAMRCFVREYLCHDVEETVNRMYEAFHEALSLGLNVRDSYHIYAEYPEEIGGPVNLKDFPMRVCIPVIQNPQGPAFLDIPAVSGVAVCHRGDYAEIGKAYDALWKYVKENKLNPAGTVRECYLDSRREYKNDVDRYVTRLVLPVKERRRTW